MLEDIYMLNLLLLNFCTTYVRCTKSSHLTDQLTRSVTDIAPGSIVKIDARIHLNSHYISPPIGTAIRAAINI